MKKIISKLLICSMLAGMLLIPSQAASTTEEIELSLATLQSMGAVESTSTSSWNSALTRAQFATMIVELMESNNLLAGVTYRSPFSDVTTSYWANAAISMVYQQGIMNGCGDGTFAPDRGITLGEAVTSVLRMLGYTSSDIGYSWPADYVSVATSLGLLDGISAGSYDTMTYGQGVLLLYAMLQQDTSSGSDYIEELCTTTVSNVTIIGTDETSGDKNELLYVLADGTFAYYEQVSEFPEELVASCRGTLLLDSNGKAMGFVPNDELIRTVSVTDVSSSGITGSSRYTYSVPSSATLLIGDDKTTYGSSYYDLEGYDEVTLCYGTLGTVELVVAQSNLRTEGYVITGYYESAYPNAAQPETIQILGAELDVDSTYASQFASIAIGERMHVTLDSSGTVVGVQKYSSSLADTMVGVYNGNSVTLSCGIVVTGDITSYADEGSLARVTSTGVGEFTVNTISASGGSSNLNLVTNKLGTYSLAEGIVIYECVDGGVATKLTLSEITVDTISYRNIRYYHVNDDGAVDIILLDDATGASYTFGIVVSSSITTSSSSFGSYTNNTFAVENSEGTTSPVVNGDLVIYEDEPAGVVLNADGEIVSYAILESAGEVILAAFDGSDTVVGDGVRYPISTDVQVYNTDGDYWTTLDLAKTSCNTFELFYDKAPEDGGQVRVIFVSNVAK